jgi:hypothetical protein
MSAEESNEPPQESFVMKNFRRLVILAVYLIAIGVVLSTTLGEGGRPLGIVLLAAGGLFFIVGMNQKKKQDQATKDKAKESG